MFFRCIYIVIISIKTGFGKALLSWRDRVGTVWKLGWLPLGGYVKMAGENIEDPRAGQPDEFLSKTKWERFQILIAGPVMNILLALRQRDATGKGTYLDIAMAEQSLTFAVGGLAELFATVTIALSDHVIAQARARG